MRYVVTDDALGYMKKWGDNDFVVGAGETKHVVKGGALPPAGVPEYHCTVVGDEIVEMGALAKAAVDADRAAKDAAKLTGATKVSRVVASEADLPLPPPEPGLLIGVMRSGKIALAMSGDVQWFIFEPVTVVSIVK